MKRFIFQAKNGNLFFFICMGDECNMCNSCKVRFGCYTGEILEVRGLGGGRVESLEVGIFGKINYKLFYDNEMHDKYYHINSSKGKRGRGGCYRCVAQSG